MADALFAPLCSGMLADGHAVRFRASGFSMHPAIRNGEWMVVEPVSPASVRCGDVVLYRSVRGLTAHRVVRVVAGGGAPGRFVFRGDGFGALDEHVDCGQILGRVARVERGRRHFDPASMHARISSKIWRTIAMLRRTVHELATGWRLLLLPKNGQCSARQGGSS